MTAEDHTPGTAQATTEAELASKAQAGDHAAFTQLVKQHMRPIYLSAYALMRNHDDANDCAQEAFVRAWRALRTFDVTRPFGPWIQRIARNVCYSELRGRSTRREVAPRDNEGNEVDPPDTGPNPREQLEQQDQEQLVWRAIEQLGENDREIIVMCDLQEMSYKDIATALEIPLGTVMSRLFNARRRLRSLLEPDLRPQASDEGPNET